jgi:hypothetical protein
MIEKHPAPDKCPEVIILSVGINNRSNRESTHIKQVKDLLTTCTEKFPSSHIILPQINIPPKVPPYQKLSLHSLNNAISQTVRSLKNCKTLPTLPEENYQINPKDTMHIHWSENTANQMISHWLNHLN